jgi:hypothetical protein
MAEVDIESQIEFNTSGSVRVSRKISHVGAAMVVANGSPMKSSTRVAEAYIHP